MLLPPVIYKSWLDSVIINKELVFFLSSKSATDSSHAHWHLTLILLYSESLGLYTAWLNGGSSVHENMMYFWLFGKLYKV